MNRYSVKKLLPPVWRLSLIRWGWIVSSLLYRGNRVACNCCGRRFRKFLPFGADRRRDACCPYCHSLERERLMYFYFQRMLKDLPASSRLKVLHFAPERSISRLFKQCASVEYVDADLNPALADHVIDITAIPFPDHRFDLIICSHVLGHIPDQERAVQELKNKLSVGGTLLIITHLLPIEEPSRKVDQSSFIGLPYKQTDRVFHHHGVGFEKLLESNGLKVERLDYAATFTPEERALYCLGDGSRELFFLCSKCDCPE